MTSVAMQKDLVLNLKKETFLNVCIISKVKPMSSELSRLIFKDNALDKPTQNMFYHLSYYLVSIIDPLVADKFSWPLYDTVTERVFRGQLTSFLNDYSSKGLLSPVMSSYLVNPACYKVTILMFQMSQLAVQRLLPAKLTKKQEKVYKEMTEKYKTGSQGFLNEIDSTTIQMSSKFSNYFQRKDSMEKIAAILRDRIISMENKLSTTRAQSFINNIVDKYLKKSSLDEVMNKKILDIKDVSNSAVIFDSWLEYMDIKIDDLENKWKDKMTPILKLSSVCQNNTEALIERYTGKAERSSYALEYNHSTDEICTRDLQNVVNSEQKYILKNIVRNDCLNFPNLVQAFVISICYILKNSDIGDEVYKFNEYLGNGHKSYSEIILAMKMLNERVYNAEAKLEPTYMQPHEPVSIRDFEIPPLPDLADIKANGGYMAQVLFDTFTPLSTSKHQFNLRQKHNSFNFMKPKSKIFTPFHAATHEDNLKNLISCRVSAYDFFNVTNIPGKSETHFRVNETMPECSAGFTKQQLMRLLSTKKSSSSKKSKWKTERPVNDKKRGLFNISDESYESSGLFRSYSSPNLFVSREKIAANRHGRRKLSVMQEDSPSLLEVSGIAALQKDDSFGISDRNASYDSRKVSRIPIKVITNKEKEAEVLKDIEFDTNKEIGYVCAESKEDLHKSKAADDEVKTDTPKNNGQLQKRTSSLEKIINRFKKVRANVLCTDEESEFQTIVEEKENVNPVNVDVFPTNRVLLPDLLSPSCSMITVQSGDYLDQLCMELDEVESRKPRQSLGTALGVDNTFLDQFDLID